MRANERHRLPSEVLLGKTSVFMVTCLPVERIGEIMQRPWLGPALQRVMLTAQLCHEWTRIVGELWGQASWPLRLQNGTLWLGVADVAWAQRFAFESRRLGQRIEAYLGCSVALRCKIAPRPERPQFEPSNLGPVLDDPEVLAAIAGMPAGPIRDAIHDYLGRVAALQRQEKRG